MEAIFILIGVLVGLAVYIGLMILCGMAWFLLMFKLYRCWFGKQFVDWFNDMNE